MKAIVNLIPVEDLKYRAALENLAWAINYYHFVLWKAENQDTCIVIK